LRKEIFNVTIMDFLYQEVEPALKEVLIIHEPISCCLPRAVAMSVSSEKTHGIINFQRESKLEIQHPCLVFRLKKILAPN
jgi:hypothetical protein